MRQLIILDSHHISGPARLAPDVAGVPRPPVPCQAIGLRAGSLARERLTVQCRIRPMPHHEELILFGKPFTETLWEEPWA